MMLKEQVIHSGVVLLLDDVEGGSYSFKASVVFWMMSKEQLMLLELVFLLADFEGASKVHVKYLYKPPNN